LNWLDVDPRTSSEHLYGFDFSIHAVKKRQQQIPHRTHHEFAIRRTGGAIELRLGRLAHQVPVDGLGELLEHLLLKQMLNIHSTLVMGRLGRYENNIMTWVSPTNNKLIDRATRYVQHLLASAGHPDPGYDQVVHELFAEMDESAPGESVVLRTYRALSRRKQAS
jgi:N-acetylmuramic acid 6-phosphate etherase